jgi:hypothetical protein
VKAARFSVAFVVGTFVAGALMAMACGGDDASKGPPPLATSTVSRDAGARETGGPTYLEAGPGAATTFKGRLATTTPVKFGGDPFCDYTMTLENVEIEISALESGEIIGAKVQDRTVEAALEPCPFAPAAPSLQTFALTTVTPTASGSTLAFEGGASNEPETSLVIDLARVGATYEATAGWKRTDQGPPLDWSMTLKLTLTAQ